MVFCTNSTDRVEGLEDAPDVFVEIDLMQIPEFARKQFMTGLENSNTVMIEGSIPREAITRFVPVQPGDLPEELRVGRR